MCIKCVDLNDLATFTYRHNWNWNVIFYHGMVLLFCSSWHMIHNWLWEGRSTRSVLKITYSLRWCCTWTSSTSSSSCFHCLVEVTKTQTSSCENHVSITSLEEWRRLGLLKNGSLDFYNLIIDLLTINIFSLRWFSVCNYIYK